MTKKKGSCAENGQVRMRWQRSMEEAEGAEDARPARDPEEDIDLRPYGERNGWTPPNYVLIINEHDGGDVSYGIGRFEDGEVRGAIPDITDDESLARSMLEKINENGLDPLHLADVVEDMMP